MAQEVALMRSLASNATDVDPAATTQGLIGGDVDPELDRQLDLAKDNEMIEAVFVLRQSGADMQEPSDPEALLRRVSRDEPLGAIEHTVLPRLGVLIVRAHAHIIRRLLAQPAVVAASANRRQSRM
jgi:hypothetical protein